MVRLLSRKLLLAVIVVGGASPLLYAMEGLPERPAGLPGLVRGIRPFEEMFHSLRLAIDARNLEGVNHWLRVYHNRLQQAFDMDRVRWQFHGLTPLEYAKQVVGLNDGNSIVVRLREYNL